MKFVTRTRKPRIWNNRLSTANIGFLPENGRRVNQSYMKELLFLTATATTQLLFTRKFCSWHGNFRLFTCTAKNHGFLPGFCIVHRFARDLLYPVTFTLFYNAFSTFPVYVLLDVCSMLKLFRNTLGRASSHTRMDAISIGSALWNFTNCTKRNALRLANKIRSTHIQWLLKRSSQVLLMPFSIALKYSNLSSLKDLLQLSSSSAALTVFLTHLIQEIHVQKGLTSSSCD